MRLTNSLNKNKFIFLRARYFVTIHQQLVPIGSKHLNLQKLTTMSTNNTINC